MIDGSEKRNRQLAFKLQNSHVCEKRSNASLSDFTRFFALKTNQKMAIFVWISSE